MGIKLQVQGASDGKGTYLVLENVAVWAIAPHARLWMSAISKFVTIDAKSKLCFANSCAPPSFLQAVKPACHAFVRMSKLLWLQWTAEAIWPILRTVSLSRSARLLHVVMLCAEAGNLCFCDGLSHWQDTVVLRASIACLCQLLLIRLVGSRGSFENGKPKQLEPRIGSISRCTIVDGLTSRGDAVVLVCTACAPLACMASQIYGVLWRALPHTTRGQMPVPIVLSSSNRILECAPLTRTTCVCSVAVQGFLLAELRWLPGCRC
jgi:hypothetical protein